MKLESEIIYAADVYATRIYDLDAILIDEEDKERFKYLMDKLDAAEPFTQKENEDYEDFIDRIIGSGEIVEEYDIDMSIYDTISEDNFCLVK